MRTDSPAPPALPAARLDRLNTARALAIIGVFLFHSYTTVFGNSFTNVEQAATTWSLPVKSVAVGVFLALSGAHHLVGIFFIMSGFTLHRIFRRWRTRNRDQNGQSFARFFIWHRFWRLVPPFWAALLIAYFLGYDDPLSFESLRKLVVNATLLKTLYPGYFFSINYAHWYVAVQWQLDLLYPLFLFIVWRRSFALAFGISCAMAVIFNFVVPALTNADYFTNLPFRWWAEWTLGAFVAEMHAKGRRVFPRPFASLLVLGALFALGLGLHWNFILWVVPRIGLALLLERIVLSRGPFGRWERWIAPIGLCSYSIYLLHLTVLEQTSRVFRLSGIPLRNPGMLLAFCLVGFALTAVVSWISYRFIEEKSVAYGTALWRRRRARALRRKNPAAVPA